jgi:hypothetical protein
MTSPITGFFFPNLFQNHPVYMIALEQRMDPIEFKMLTGGDFTIRRSDKSWSGLCSDLRIEQKVMRSMKSYGGLTQRHGTSSSVLPRWTVT